MAIPPRRPSAGMRSIHRELERRRPKPLAPKRPAAKEPSAPPPLPPSSRDAADGKVLKPCARPVRKIPSEMSSSLVRAASAGTNPPPPKRPRLLAPPRDSFQVNLLPSPSSRYDSSVVRSAAYLKPARRAPPSRSIPASAAPPPSSRDGAQGKVLKCARSVRKNPSSITFSMVLGGSASTNPPPPKRLRLQAPPRSSFDVSPLPPPPFRSVRSQVGSASASILGAASLAKPARGAPSRPSSASSAPQVTPPPTSSSAASTSTATSSSDGLVKPGTRVAIRTRSQAMVDGRPIVLWLPGRVISANNSSYEVIYEGKLPRENPFSTVDVPLHHVKLIKPSQPTLVPPPSSQPSSPAAKSSASATNTEAITSKSLETQTPSSPRPTTGGKCLRLTREPPAKTKPAARPTTAGKRISVIRRTLSEKDRQILDASCSRLGFGVLD